MLDPKLFDELNSKVGALLAATPAGDIEKNLRALLGAFFNKLDLVTREEFDLQADLLARTRSQLQALEARVAALENKTGPTPR